MLAELVASAVGSVRETLWPAPLPASAVGWQSVALLVCRCITLIAAFVLTRCVLPVCVCLHVQVPLFIRTLIILHDLSVT